MLNHLTTFNSFICLYVITEILLSGNLDYLIGSFDSFGFCTLSVVSIGRMGHLIHLLNSNYGLHLYPYSLGLKHHFGNGSSKESQFLDYISYQLVSSGIFAFHGCIHGHLIGLFLICLNHFADHSLKRFDFLVGLLLFDSFIQISFILNVLAYSFSVKSIRIRWIAPHLNTI